VSAYQLREAYRSRGIKKKKIMMKASNPGKYSLEEIKRLTVELNQKV